MSTSTVTFEAEPTLFEIDNARDHIQAHHVRGEFYELDQLLAHREVVPERGTIIDIGANVGNHTLFYAKHTNADRVYPIEPNLRARKLLEQNIAANGNYRALIDTSHVRLAIGRRRGRVQAMDAPANNLGGTQFVATADASAVECARLDELAFEGHVAFVKIDVEGMEMDALAGAAKLIAQARPVIAVEVLEPHEHLFWKWLRANDYHVVRMFSDYLYCKNYILTPASAGVRLRGIGRMINAFMSAVPARAQGTRR